MADITLRTGLTGKGAPLTLEQVDQNFININNELGLKLYTSDFTGAAVLSRLLDVDEDLAGINSSFLRSLAPSASVPSTTDKSSIVSRDSSGHFSAVTMTGDLTGNVVGDLTGTVTGSLTGPSAGLHTGNVVGNVSGSLSGPSNGFHTGNVEGNVTGNVEGTLTGPSFGVHTGNVFGNVQGNVTGNVSGNAGTVTNGVYTTSSYYNPSWITALNGSKIYSIPNASLQNSSITINGASVALGGSASIPAGIRAWVVFNGATGAIINSYNVDSVVRTGAGKYTINITPGTFTDGNYCVSGILSDNDHVLNWVSSTSVELKVSTHDPAMSNNSSQNTQRVNVMMIG
jgi:hypothetical protein